MEKSEKQAKLHMFVGWHNRCGLYGATLDQELSLKNLKVPLDSANKPAYIYAPIIV
jgi:hypothetical protein